MNENEGLGTGSGRSVTGVDLRAYVIAARQAGLLSRGGGHRMAAGFTVTKANLPAFREFLDERVAARVAEACVVPSLYLDGALTSGGANLELIEALERLAPFGSGNSEPRFVIPSARVSFADIVGGDHVRCSFESRDGSRLEGDMLSCCQPPARPAPPQGAGTAFACGGTTAGQLLAGQGFATALCR